MKKEKGKFFDLSTAIGCKRLFLVLFAAVLVFSFCAQLISSNGGKVKIETVAFDYRGAIISGELYYPAGTSDRDKLPCVILSHGGAINHTCMRGFAEELARRGYVVINMSAYGAGISEQPPYDDGGQGLDGYSTAKTPAGTLDILEFARNIKFVDQTRIGMAGHSMGSIRVANIAAVVDCGFFTLNDMKINILHETFGINFTEDEIYQDADAIAAEKLTDPKDLEKYKELAAEAEEYFNTRVKSIIVFGAAAEVGSSLHTVNVGGIEVTRTLQCNMGVVNGAWDDLSADYLYPKKDYVKEGWYTNGADAETGKWYVLDDQNMSSTILGDWQSVNILNSDELKTAIENRRVRVCKINNETHARNFFSKETASDVVYFFEQTLGYNNGNVGETSNSIPASQIVYRWRAHFNLLAFFCMVAAFFPLLRMLLMSQSFGMCKIEGGEAKNNLTKRGYWILCAVTVAAVFGIQYYIRQTGSEFHKKLNHTFFPLANSSGYQIFFVSFLAIFSLVALIVLCIINKKKNGDTGLKALNLWPGAKIVGKSLLVALIMLFFGYMCLMLINYLFIQEFRFWQIEFGLMKADYWAILLRYMVIIFPACFINSALLNYSRRYDIPEWKDTLLAVVFNSLGIYLIFIVNLIIAATSFDGTLFCSFSASHPLLIMVPLTTLIAKKTYNRTNTIWIGSAINALLIGWGAVSLAGIYNYYYGQTWLSVVLGL